MKTNRIWIILTLALAAGPALLAAEAENERSPGGFVVAGADAEVAVDATGNTDAHLVLAGDGTVGWDIWHDDSNGRLYFDSGAYSDFFYISSGGQFDIDYPGSSTALQVSGSSNVSLVSSVNSGTFGRGLTAGMSSTSAGSDAAGVYGYAYGAAAGVRGKAYSMNAGVHGINDAFSNEGWLGLHSCGVAGMESDGNVGKLGTSMYGVEGFLADPASGRSGIYGSCSDDTLSGIAYHPGSTISGVKGEHDEAMRYTFGVSGYATSYNQTRCGGTFGGVSPNSTVSNWGCLGYRSSGSSNYGGYFTSYTTGTGKSDDDLATGIGSASSGDLMGAWVRGDEYGQYVRGERYAQFARGDSYTEGALAVVQETSEERMVTYAPTSRSADVYAYGVGQVIAGEARLEFEGWFRELVSTKEPIVVTATAVGRSAALFIDSIDPDGFVVRDDRDGDATFTWIAIGKRRDLEEHQAPEEILHPEFDDRMEQVTWSDADTERDALGIYIEDGKLQFGEPPHQEGQHEDE